MSRFYMTMTAGMNHSATITRRAHAGHGAESVVASYHGCVRVTPYVDDAGVDCVRVVRDQWQRSGGGLVVLYDGPFAFNAPGYKSDLIRAE